ncbi:MAG: class I SAM-dependent methyltransferase [Thermoplasmata archaeon]
MTGALPASLPLISKADRRCPGWALDNRIRRWWAPARHEVDPLSIQPGHRIVDLGAGVGYVTAVLLERVGPAGSVILVDPDARSLGMARMRWGPDRRVQFIQASAAHIPMIAEASADGVVLSLVLCCMVEKGGALDEAWRILRPGGLVMASYPERRWRLSARKMSLRVSSEIWSRLVGGHPWRVVASHKRRFIRRHLLQKPSIDPSA